MRRNLISSLKELQRAVEQGHLPDDRVIARFVEDSDAFAAMADPEWSEPVKEYMDHLESLKRAAADRQLEMMTHEVRDLRARMIECHREFK